jgi:hypothetical protein
MSPYNRIAAQLIALLTIATSIMAAVRTTEGDGRFTVQLTIERAQRQASVPIQETTIRRRPQ